VIRRVAQAGSPSPRMSPTPQIEFRGIAKRFPGVLALDGVSFSVAPGSCHALIGENGAGKSTLGKILVGILTADAGTVLLEGRPSPPPPHSPPAPSASPWSTRNWRSAPTSASRKTSASATSPPGAGAGSDRAALHRRAVPCSPRSAPTLIRPASLAVLHSRNNSSRSPPPSAPAPASS
jgi:energy-coupling factor transporter ATP-binding protein EcfA2